MKFLILAAVACCTTSIAVAQAPRCISRGDQAKIRAAVQAVTNEPILDLDAVTLSHFVPGAVAYKGIEAAVEHGKVATKPRIFYERTDQVVVATGSRANLKGSSYVVERVGSTWEVTHKSYWIH